MLPAAEQARQSSLVAELAALCAALQSRLRDKMVLKEVAGLAVRLQELPGLALPEPLSTAALADLVALCLLPAAHSDVSFPFELSATEAPLPVQAAPDAAVGRRPVRGAAASAAARIAAVAAAQPDVTSSESEEEEDDSDDGSSVEGSDAGQDAPAQSKQPALSPRAVLQPQNVQ